MSRLMLVLRSLMVALLLAFGVIASGPVAAQDGTAVVEQAEDAAEDADNQAEETAQDVEEEAEGFDDWGLLGLLGLAGLAGLFRRPQPVVHETERTRVDSTRI